MLDPSEYSIVGWAISHVDRVATTTFCDPDFAPIVPFAKQIPIAPKYLGNRVGCRSLAIATKYCSVLLPLGLDSIVSGYMCPW
jgi:hypothetical protein